MFSIKKLYHEEIKIADLFPKNQELLTKPKGCLRSAPPEAQATYSNMPNKILMKEEVIQSNKSYTLNLT
jgi:hypothetical protein